VRVPLFRVDDRGTAGYSHLATNRMSRHQASCFLKQFQLITCRNCIRSVSNVIHESDTSEELFSLAVQDSPAVVHVKLFVLHTAAHHEKGDT
jgi:hypothetical protein